MSKTEKYYAEKISSLHKESIIGSKVSIVRNFENIPFVDMLSNEQKDILEDELTKFIGKKKKNLCASRAEDLPDMEKEMLKERGLISNDMLQQKRVSFMYNDTMSVIFNYKNHLMINCVDDGLQLKSLYKQAKDLELKCGVFSEYLVSTKYGYLSPYFESCGLGLTISVVLHLVGIARAGKEEDIKQKLFERGYIVNRWGTNSEESCFFEISSRLNYGLSENDLIERFEIGIKEILEIENQTLSEYYYDNKNMEDEIFRSVGIMKYARMMKKEEAVKHISNIKTGFKLKIDLPVTTEAIAHICRALLDTGIEKIALSEHCSDEAVRASLIRTFMEDNNV